MKIEIAVLVLTYFNLQQDFPEGKRDQAALAEPGENASSSPNPSSPRESVPQQFHHIYCQHWGNYYRSSWDMFT